MFNEVHTPLLDGWSFLRPARRVVRLRGDASTLVWPEREMDLAMGAARKLLRHKAAEVVPRQRGQEYSEARESRWQNVLRRSRTAGHIALAQANGWDVSDDAYRPLLLLRSAHRASAGHHLPWCFHAGLFEFPYWIRLAHDQAGVVVHLRERLELNSVPAELVVDQLPNSWHEPDVMNAYLLRPAPK